MKIRNNKFESHKKSREASRNVKGLKLGMLISRLDTFADIKTGKFRRMFNRHAKVFSSY